MASTPNERERRNSSYRYRHRYRPEEPKKLAKKQWRADRQEE